MDTTAAHLLTWEEAKTRSLNISDVHYELRVWLTKAEGFGGDCRMKFTAQSEECTWVEFKGKEVKELSVNGVIKEIEWKSWKLSLPGTVVGANSVKILFENDYVNDGLGLHKYTDPEDSEIYLYTQYEPFSANKMFPCFDQPDLKATLKLYVVAPSDWIVITNEKAEKTSNPAETEDKPPRPANTPEGEYVLHEFPETPKISTYLYALCAGPYSEWRNDVNEAEVPLGLYCRKGLSQYMVPERYFHWTIEGFKFYKDFFGIKYPFRKYDQVFVPEFNFGAMENVGCVTYRDQYVFKDPPSHIQLTRVCDTFLHEMAHMWFGDLVTMKWWNDLWLNESFATFMSHLCISLQLGNEYPNVWIEFLGLKGWGYAEDQLSTTHPISTPVRDTNECESNFDGISYAKGSAVLKQLYFVVGHDLFKTAVQKYMKDFSFKNAEFADLIRYIEAEVQASGTEIDIPQWAENWVKTSGLNELEPIVEYSEGKITTFKVRQTCALTEHPTLRTHRMIVEAFGPDGSSVKKETVVIQPTEFTELPELVGVPAASVLLNSGDWAYCKVRIDENSMLLFKSTLSTMTEQLSKQLIWRALYDMVRDIKMSGVEFVEFALLQIPLEGDATIANYSIEISSTCLFNYIEQGEAKDRLAHSMFEVILAKMQTASNREELIIYQKKLLGYCHTLPDIERAVEWVKNNETGITGFSLGKLDRWVIIKKYSEHTTDARGLLDVELANDASDSGKLGKLYCEAAFPTAEAKAAAWAQFTSCPESFSRYERESAMGGFNRARQSELLLPYFEQYFSQTLEFFSTKDRETSKDFCEYLVPSYVSEPAVIEKLQTLIPAIPEERFEVKRSLKERIEFLTKFHQGKALSRAYLERTHNS